MKRLNRRELFGAAAAAIAGSALGREAHAAGLTAGATETGGRATRTVAGASSPGDGERSLALLDGMLMGDDLARARATLESPEPTILQPDLLWQWRRELAQELAKGVRAVAITRWDKAFVLSGLAREAALPIRQQRIARSLFQTEIG